MKTSIKITLLLIIILAGFLRIYKVDQIPPSVSWDEAAVGYNAYTIANWGRDEWGKVFPAYFRSFEDDKHPVHIYFTAATVKVFGLSEFSTRLPAAIFGVLNVILVFFLARIFFKSDITGILASLFLAISPYNLQFSRFNHEANFALFFLMLGLFLFFWGKDRSKFFLPLSFFSFGISLLSYHSSKIVVPPIVFLLVTLYFRDLWKIKKYFLTGILLLGLTLSIIFLNPPLLGTARMKQTSIPDDVIKRTSLFKKTNNQLLGRTEVAWQRYQAHISPQYLFVTGDPNDKFSIQTVGMFYKLDALFLILGLVGLILKRTKTTVILLAWVILGPIPPSLAGGEGEVPHAARALFVMGSWHLLAAYGFSLIINIFRKPVLKIGLVSLGLLVLSFMFKDYLVEYYQNYGNKHAIGWQYGMKQSIEYIKEHNGYPLVYATDIRFQPYIFFLYYLKTPLPEFRASVYYNDTWTRGYNLVSFFDKYHFGDWDPIESMPNPGVMYILTSSQYDGLRHKNVFDVKKIVKYPGGGDAFFLVSYP